MNGSCSVENPKQRSQYRGKGFRGSLRLEGLKCGKHHMALHMQSVRPANATVYNLLMLLPKAIPIQHKLCLKTDQIFNIPLLHRYGYQTKGKGQLQFFFSSGDLRKGEVTVIKIHVQNVHLERLDRRDPTVWLSLVVVSGERPFQHCSCVL